MGNSAQMDDIKAMLATLLKLYMREEKKFERFKAQKLFSHAVTERN